MNRLIEFQVFHMIKSNLLCSLQFDVLLHYTHRIVFELLEQDDQELILC